MLRITILSMAFAALLAASSRGQTTWYVDISVSGPGTGTIGDPYRSIRYALQQPSTVAGDTLLVAPGVYVEHVGFAKLVTVRSSAGPLLTAIRPDASGPTVSANTGGSFALLEGFTVYGNPDAFAIHANDFDVRHCIVIGDGQTGVGLAAVDRIRAEHCTVYGFGVGASGIVHGAEVELKDSIVYGNNLDFADTVWSYTWYASSYYYGPSGLGPPGFFDGAGHDYHLVASSGCIDAGDPASPLDPDGSRADMGAVPFDANYAPFTVYCTGKLNSAGCVPTIGAVNNASLSSGRPFWITCSNELNQKNGFLFYGFAPKNTAYQGGYLCVQAPTRRTPLQNSGGNAGPDDCSGVFALEFNSLLQSGVDPGLALGTEVFCQYWSRDPAASFFTNRSDALRFTVQI